MGILSSSLSPLPGRELLDERWLTLLIAGQLKKERLVEIRLGARYGRGNAFRYQGVPPQPRTQPGALLTHAPPICF